MGLRQWIRYALKAREAWHVLSEQMGWRDSFQQGRPLAGDGSPIPWYTYPAIEFLRSLDLSACRVFEYGCGNSSWFWAERAKQVVAVENDPAWAEAVRGKNIPQLTVMVATEKQEYVNAPHAAGGVFDVVIIDGRHRTDCARLAADMVHDQGMIIFDNADWYAEACQHLRSKGWFQIDFSGLGPINPYAWTTAAFVKASVAIPRGAQVQPTGGNPAGAL